MSDVESLLEIVMLAIDPPLYKSTLKIANNWPIFTSYYAFVIVSLTWLAYSLSHDYLSDYLVFYLFIFCLSLT